MTLTNVSTNIPPLWGRSLRFVLVDEIRHRSQITVKELAAALQAQGFSVQGRASKTISDALRWEVARGRVVRVGRGVYRYGSAPASTARRVRLFAERCRAWIVALTRTQQPPPTPAPAHHRYLTVAMESQPGRPPWQDLGWLWSS